MIDLASRSRLQESRKTKNLVEGMKEAISSSLKGTVENKRISEIESKFKESETKMSLMFDNMKQHLADALANKSVSTKDGLRIFVSGEGEKDFISELKGVNASSKENTGMLEKIGKALVMVYNALPKSINLPKIFQIKGDVRVIQNVPTRINNFSELEKYFKSLEQRIITLAQAASTAQPPKIEFPKFPRIEIPKLDAKGIIEAIKGLEETFSKPNDSNEIISALNKVRQSVDAVYNKPTFIPQPSTNVSINPLQGFAKATTTTVTTVATQLPEYGQLFNRRSLIIYNNSTQTVFVGGSDVTASNGLPVPKNTYSPPIDAGYLLKVYGIVTSSTADVRVLEVSRDQTSSVQQ